MKNIPHHMLQGVALHHYSVIDWKAKGSDTEFSEELYFKSMQQAWLMDELIENHTAIMDKYDPEKKVDLIVDEWGGWYNVAEGTEPGFLFQQNTMRDAMIAGMTLNIFNNHADRVKMANLAQTVNVLQAVILTEKEKMLLTPTYQVMKMYNVHHDAQLVPVSFVSPKYRMNGEELPALSVSASKDDEGSVHISIVNIDSKEDRHIAFNIETIGINNISARILASSNLGDHNTFENPDKIRPKKFSDFKVRNGILEIHLPPFSVLVLEGDRN